MYSCGTSYTVKTDNVLCTVRLWEILMCHISLKFHDKNYILKLWKLTHEWWVQRNKGLSKNRFKIEIFIKIFSYSVKFDERKTMEKSRVSKKCYSLAAVGLGKNSGTAIADSATDWDVINVAKSCVYRENFWWKVIFFCPWERCMWKMKGVSRRYLLTRTLSEWRWVGQFSCSVIPIRPDSKDIRDFARLPTAHGI